MLMPSPATPATADPQLSEIDGIRLLQISGCSRLCVVLGGLGVVLSVGAATAAHQLLHEPLESVAAASSLHMAAAFCTANDAVLTRLALAKSAAINARHGQPDTGAQADIGQPADPTNTPVQVTTLRLDPQTSQLLQPPPAAMAPAISQLGLGALLGGINRQPTGPLSPAARKSGSTASRHGRSRANRCADHGLEVVRRHTRVFELQPQGTPSHGGTHLLYALGPWNTHGNDEEIAVALVDMDALVASVGELDGHNHAAASNHQTPLLIQNELRGHSPASDTGDHQLNAHDHQSDLSGNDQKLSNARWMAFANSELSSQVTVDHHAIDRTSRRAAAIAFVMGLSMTMIVVLISRYSQLKLLHLNRALRRESRTDGLTKLANRRAWDEALLRADQLRQRQDDTYAVVVIDLDGFKQINDTQGHQQGDQILIKAAETLRTEVRDADLAARLGGDEFGILLINPSQEGLDECVNRLSAVLNNLAIKASIGASLSQADRSLETTWAEADASMYSAKRDC